MRDYSWEQMPNQTKLRFLDELQNRYGMIEKLGDSLSLFGIANSELRIYVRYSKLHPNGKAWYGLRATDFQRLEGYPSVICFLWDNQPEPLFVPFSKYEEVFQSTTPADDGQFKVQIEPGPDGTDFYIARVGHYNVDGYFGWEQLDAAMQAGHQAVPDLSHSQVQSLLGAIGTNKNFDVWIPSNNRGSPDWALSNPFEARTALPSGFDQIEDILGQVDVIWIAKGGNDIRALFEVEHSTSIYSGLLRFNDIHLVAPNLKTKFSIVSNSERRSRFARQLNRPTFRASGLSELCTFFEYPDVFNWHQRITRR